MIIHDAYQAALDYLYGFTNFEHKRPDQYTAEKFELARPMRFMELLGNPHRQFPSLHIAGTKGKGSVAAMCAAGLQAAGLRVGLYTSPHLQEFRDRIRIVTPDDGDGRISEGQLVALVERLKTVVPQVEGITWFELVTALAFTHFAQEQVDVAVVEVGLGGRLDATNVVTPLVSVITSLSLDHTQILGNTLAEIAYEKGGIIKPGVPVVSAAQKPEAMTRLEEIAEERNAPLIVVGRDWQYEALGQRDGKQQIAIVRAPGMEEKEGGGGSQIAPMFEVGLAGRYQQENGVVALAALTLVRPYFPTLTAEAMAAGLATVQWPGRLQIVHEAAGTPTILVDCAHNEDSAEKLADSLVRDYLSRDLYLSSETKPSLWLVFGATADKNVAAMLGHLFPIADGTFVTASGHPRAAKPNELAELAAEMGYQARVVPGVENALRAAWDTAGPDDLICVTGSIFIVGDLLNQWDSLKSNLLVAQ